MTHEHCEHANEEAARDAIYDTCGGCDREVTRGELDSGLCGLCSADYSDHESAVLEHEAARDAK